MLDTVVDGVAALNTNDLFLRHPSNPNLWKVYGRLGEDFRGHSFHPIDTFSPKLDDQIMHSTGEKARPCPCDTALC